jgi:hypothetical protein
MYKLVSTLATLTSAFTLLAFIGVLTPQPVLSQAEPKRVIVDNLPSAPVPVAGSVSVTNSSALPLSVRDVDKNSRQPFSHLISLGFLPGTLDTSPNPVPAFGSYTVPVGKRLVIEDASAVVHVPVGQKAHINMRLIAPNGDPFLVRYRHLTLTFQMSDSPTDIFVAGEPVRIYLDAGARVEALGRRTGVGGSGFVELVIYGYLVDIP